MRQLILNIILFIFSFQFGFSQEWVKISYENSAVSVEMPQVPKFELENVFTIDGNANKITYSTNFEQIYMVFEALEILGKGNKAEKAVTKNLIERTMIENHGTTSKILKRKKGDIFYSYIETPLITGELIRSVVFVHQGFIYQIYVKGIISDVFNQNANYFLDSWGIENTTIEAKEEMNTDFLDSTYLQKYKSEEWVSVEINSTLNIQFPSQPFKLKKVIENGLNDIEIDSYALTDYEKGVSYVVSVIPYNRDQGQLTNASIYSYYLDRIKKNKKFKLVREEPIDRPHEGIEYIFSNGINFYRINLIRINNVMYQFLVKGKRKSIKNSNSEYFFNNIDVSN